MKLSFTTGRQGVLIKKTANKPRCCGDLLTGPHLAGDLTFVFVTMATNGYVRQNLNDSLYVCVLEGRGREHGHQGLLCFNSPLEMIVTD